MTIDVKEYETDSQSLFQTVMDYRLAFNAEVHEILVAPMPEPMGSIMRRATVVTSRGMTLSWFGTDVKIRECESVKPGHAIVVYYQGSGLNC